MCVRVRISNPVRNQRNPPYLLRLHASPPGVYGSTCVGQVRDDVDPKRGEHEGYSTPLRSRTPKFLSRGSGRPLLGLGGRTKQGSRDPTTWSTVTIQNPSVVESLVGSKCVDTHCTCSREPRYTTFGPCVGRDRDRTSPFPFLHVPGDCLPNVPTPRTLSLGTGTSPVLPSVLEPLFPDLLSLPRLTPSHASRLRNHDTTNYPK